MRHIYFIVLSIILFNSCNREDSNPLTPNNDSNIIFYSSFESDNSPSFVGWEYPPGNPTNLTSFSQDVPTGGGHWSLQIKGTQGLNYFPFIESETILSNPDSTAVYILSFWAKGKGIVHFGLWGPDTGWVMYSWIDSPTWQYFTDTLQQRSRYYNRLEIDLASANIDSLSTVNYDLFKIMVLAYN
jgi:hypothetical protein